LAGTSTGTSLSSGEPGEFSPAWYRLRSLLSADFRIHLLSTVRDAHALPNQGEMLLVAKPHTTQGTYRDGMSEPFQATTDMSLSSHGDSF